MATARNAAYPRGGVDTRHGATRPVRHGAFIAGEAVLLVLAMALAVAVKRHPGPLPEDVPVALGTQHLLLPHHALTNALDAVSTINWPIPSAITLAVVVVLFLLVRRWLDAIAVLVVGGLADASSYVTNEIVRRPRPMGHGLYVLRHIANYFSFPSGHVVHAFAVFGILLFLSYRTRHRWPWLWMVRLVLFLLIVLMAPSRVLEGEHWPSDVVEGALYGLFWLVIGTHLYHWARGRWPRLVTADERTS